MATSAVVSSMGGYLFARALKSMSNTMVFYSAMATLLVGGLHMKNWIVINFR